MPEYQERHVDRLSIVAVACAAAGLAVFAYCILTAVSLHPGWSFRQSYLSHLGISTEKSAPWFQAGICGIAIGVAPLYLNYLRFDGQRSFGAVGVVSNIGLSGVGLTPMDTHAFSHYVCLGVWLIGLGLMLVQQIREGVRTKKYLLPAVGWILGSLIFGYVTGTRRGTAPFYQKLVIGGAIFWLGLISWLTTRSAFVLVRYGVTKVGHDRGTQAYLSRLETKGMYGPDGRASGRDRRS